MRKGKSPKEGNHQAHPKLPTAKVNARRTSMILSKGMYVTMYLKPRGVFPTLCTRVGKEI